MALIVGKKWYYEAELVFTALNAVGLPGQLWRLSLQRLGRIVVGTLTPNVAPFPQSGVACTEISSAVVTQPGNVYVPVQAIPSDFFPNSFDDFPNAGDINASRFLIQVKSGINNPIASIGMMQIEDTTVAGATIKGQIRIFMNPEPDNFGIQTTYGLEETCTFSYILSNKVV